MFKNLENCIKGGIVGKNQRRNWIMENFSENIKILSSPWMQLCISFPVLLDYFSEVHNKEEEKNTAYVKSYVCEKIRNIKDPWSLIIPKALSIVFQSK